MKTNPFTLLTSIFSQNKQTLSNLIVARNAATYALLWSIVALCCFALLNLLIGGKGITLGTFLTDGISYLASISLHGVFLYFPLWIHENANSLKKWARVIPFLILQFLLLMAVLFIALLITTGLFSGIPGGISLVLLFLIVFYIALLAAYFRCISLWYHALYGIPLRRGVFYAVEASVFFLIPSLLFGLFYFLAH